MIFIFIRPSHQVKAVEAQEAVEEEAEVKADISSTQEIDCYTLAKNSDDLDIVNMYEYMEGEKYQELVLVSGD